MAEEDGVIAFGEQFFDAVLFADLDAGAEDDAAVFEPPGEVFDNFFVELEVGDAVYQQAAGAGPHVKDGWCVAELGEFFGDGQARRAAADDGDLEAGFLRHRRTVAAVAVAEEVGAEGFELADADGLFVADQNATALAEDLLRADAAADFGHVGGLVELDAGFGEAALGDEVHGVGDVVVDRAGDLAGRERAALEAARGFGDGDLGGEAEENFVPVVDALGRDLLVELGGVNPVAFRARVRGPASVVLFVRFLPRHARSNAAM